MKINNIEQDYILNTIEAEIGIFVDPEEQYNIKSGKGKIRLSAALREHHLLDESVTYYNNDLTQSFECKKLSEVTVDLGVKWMYIFAMMGESLHDNFEYTNDDNVKSHFWLFDKKTYLGHELYVVRIINGANNKVPVVLHIDLYRSRDKKMKNLEDCLQEDHVGKVRVPLFREHVRTLLKSLISLADKFDEFYFIKKYTIDEKQANGHLTFGVKRSKNDSVRFGALGYSSKLNPSNKSLLFASARHRLLYGRWMPFVSEVITMSYDGWLTDRYYEFDMEDVKHYKGALTALMIIFGIGNIDE